MESNVLNTNSFDSYFLLPADIFWPVVIILALVLLIVAIVVIARFAFHGRNIYPASFHKKIFMLTVPQRVAENEEDKNKQMSEIIGELEVFYSSLGGLLPQKGMGAWFFGRHDHWSMEIVLDSDGLITFYMAIPAYLEDFIKQQLLSAHPYCQIEEVSDYNIFNHQGVAAAGYLKFMKQNMFPILTYKQMNADPVVSLLSTLSKYSGTQTAAIQFVMRSARPNWRKFGVKVASEMLQGKNLKQAIASQSSNVLVKLLGSPSDWFFSSKKDPGIQPKELYRLSPMEEQMVKSIEEKASKAGLDTNIRIVTFANTELEAKSDLKELINSFSQYSSYQYANGFKAVIKGNVKQLIHDFIYRNFNESASMVLNSEEMTSLWHMPLPNTSVPHIRWLQAKKLAPPVNMPQEGLVLGESIYRGNQKLVRIKDGDRRRHMYIIGMTGTGKSTLMTDMAIQDIAAGRGVCIIDPHGTLVEEILPYVPKERFEDVIIFDPSDVERPIGLNMLEASSSYEMDAAAQEMINIFYKLLADPAMAGPMFEHYMRNALLVLMADQKDPGTLVELARVFTDDAYRKKKLEYVTDILVKDFWEREYVASQKGSTGSDMLSYVISKTGRFVENELMRNIIGQPKSGINFREVMDKGKILFMNLSKGKIGETNSNLLGLIAVSKLQMAALARADMPEAQRKDFYLYIDEFQNFITDSIAIILAEARKYKLNLIMAHQYIAQLTQNNDTRVKDAVFGNVGTIACYRIGVDDSEVMAKQLAPVVSEYDVMNIEKYNAYVRLLIDNTASDTFNMRHFHPSEIATGNNDLVQPLKELSRLKYGRDRRIVIREIIERSKIGQMGVKPPAPHF